jgi:hypothetical protein
MRRSIARAAKDTGDVDARIASTHGASRIQMRITGS